jgi:uncharacterized protein (TIGR02118 family)
VDHEAAADPDVPAAGTLSAASAREVRMKLIAFFKRKPGMPVDDFQRHWRTRHAELVVRQRGLRRYVQNHVLPSSYRTREPAFDGVAEAWFDDLDAMRALAPSAEYAAVRADEANFIDAASMGSVLADEAVIVDGAVPPGAVKTITCLRKRSDLSVDEFQKHWRESHATLAGRLPGQRRYVQCTARRGIYQAGRTPLYDGVALAWFDGEDALPAVVRSPEYAAMRADEPNLLVPGRAPLVVAREVEIDVRTGAAT